MESCQNGSGRALRTGVAVRMAEGRKKVTASTQTQALSAILFLYRHVIRREVGDLGEVI